MMRSSAVLGRAFGASLVLVLIGVSLTACRREKRDATKDIQKNQQQYLDQMDTIAAKIEEEEKAKKAAEQAPPAEPANEEGGDPTPALKDPDK